MAEERDPKHAEPVETVAGSDAGGWSFWRILGLLASLLGLVGFGLCGLCGVSYMASSDGDSSVLGLTGLGLLIAIACGFAFVALVKRGPRG